MNENIAAVLFAFSAGFIIVVHTMIIYAIGLRHGAGIYNKVERFILKHAYVDSDDPADDLDDLDDLQNYYEDDRYIGKYVIIGGYKKDGEK